MLVVHCCFGSDIRSDLQVGLRGWPWAGTAANNWWRPQQRPEATRAPSRIASPVPQRVAGEITGQNRQHHGETSPHVPARLVSLVQMLLRLGLEIVTQIDGREIKIDRSASAVYNHIEVAVEDRAFLDCIFLQKAWAGRPGIGEL